MELPPYKRPSPQVVFHRVYESGKSFVMRAGTLIFATNVLIWGAGYFPGNHAEADALAARIEQLRNVPNVAEETIADVQSGEMRELESRRDALRAELLEQSLLGRLGHAIEPVVRPLGWDWRIGVGALASFPAREVIVGTLGTIYSLGGTDNPEDSSLQAAVRAAEWPDGRPVYNIPVAISIMVFFALCAQCASTLVVIKRETGSWRWPAFSFTYMTLLAYIGAFIAYRVGMIFVA